MKQETTSKIKLKSWTIVCLLLITGSNSGTLRAQKEYIQQGQTYNGKMYMKTNQFVTGNSIELVNDTTLRYFTASGQENYVSTEEIHWVSIKTGSKAGTGALLGGLTGVLTALLVQMNYEIDPYAEPVDFTPLYLGFGAGGLLIGALVGSASSTTQSLYMPSYRVSQNFHFGPTLKHNYPAVHLVLKL